ncbi:AtpZ/AtpI family protein [Chloroflexota bacterium]
MKRWVAALRLTGVGFFIGLCILSGTFAGLWLDSKLNTEPIFMIAGLLAGLVVAIYGVYRMLQPLLGSDGDEEKS